MPTRGPGRGAIHCLSLGDWGPLSDDHAVAEKPVAPVNKIAFQPGAYNRGWSAAIQEQVCGNSDAIVEAKVLDHCTFRAHVDFMNESRRFAYAEIQRVCAHHLGISGDGELKASLNFGD